MKETMTGEVLFERDPSLKKRKKKSKQTAAERGPGAEGEETGRAGQQKRLQGEARVEPAAGEHKGRSYTISIAVSGSVIDNAQSLELATSLAGQIGRAAAIFNVDEVVVFDDDAAPSSGVRARRWREGGTGSGGEFLARLLQYLETPQYLRRTLIPVHPDLRFAGLLPPLDAPHHARAHEWVPYREGCVLPGGDVGGKGTSLVNVGLFQDVRIRQSVPAGVRVTVAMGEDREAALRPEALLEAVGPSEPRERGGLYWGYSVRLCQGLSQVLTACPFPDGYDCTVGTSERGERISSAELHLPPFRHLLVVFGGPAGLEESVELDSSLEVKEAQHLFDRYINTCPRQGSRTIRTEEAILISMAYFQEAIWRATGQHPFAVT